MRPLPPAVAEELLALVAQLGESIPPPLGSARVRLLCLLGSSALCSSESPPQPPISLLLTIQVARNMRCFSDWSGGDDRRDEILNPRTRLLVLRRRGNADGGDAGTGAAVGFASYRLTSQETVTRRLPTLTLTLTLHLSLALTLTLALAPALTLTRYRSSTYSSYRSSCPP